MLKISHKEKIKEKREKININISNQIILVFVYCLIITFICMKLYSLDIVSMIQNIKSNFYIFTLNFIPIFFLTLLIGLLINNIYISSTIISFISLLGSLVNRYKIIYRDEPFTFNDLQIYKEAINAVSDMNYSINILLIVFLILIIILPLIINKFFKNNKFTKKLMVITLIPLTISILLLNIFVYASTDIYNSFTVYGTQYRKSDHFKSKGFIYSFIYNLNQKGIYKPENYNTKDVENILSNYDKNDEKEFVDKPNIIFVLSESFWDPSILPNLELNKDNYVLENYERIKKDSILSGNVVVKGFGGGTAYSEFEVLTGINPEILSVENPFEILKSKVHSVPNILKDIGYKTIAMHPGQPWFYNRQNGYKYLGIDEQYFIDYYDPDNTDNYVGGYISEKLTFEYLIESIKKNLENSNQPLFYNLVTIQNHGPYENKYLYEDEYVDFNINGEISDKSYNIIKNYLYGLKDCDTQIGVLTDYLDSIDSPFIVIYYGDHLPYLADAYKELGLDFESNNLNNEIVAHSTPYFIWANDSAKSLVNEKYVKEIKNKKSISINYLPVLAFNCVNFDQLSSYFEFVNDLLEQFDILFNSIYIKNDDLYELNPNLSDIVKNWSLLEYYYLKEKNIEE